MLQQYYYEREGKIVHQTSKGFAVYSYENEYCYISDIFVLKEHRKSGEAARIADKISEIAKNDGYKKLAGSVDSMARGATNSLKVLLAYGFKLLRVDGSMIYFEKEL